MVRLIKIRSVEDITGFKKSSIYKRIQQGTFPRPVKIGRASRWASDEVDAWVNSLCDQTNKEPDKTRS